MKSNEVKHLFTKRLFSSEDGITTMDDINYLNLINTKTELIYLYSQMRSKYEEIKLRTGVDNKELLNNAMFLERVSLLITKLQLCNEEYSNELNELKRQNEYYRSQLPRIDLTKVKQFWNGREVKYIKDFINDDNY